MRLYKVGYGVRCSGLKLWVLVLVSVVHVHASPAQELAGTFESTVLDIGVEDGDERYVFGHIADAAVGPDGRIFVLDDMAGRLSVFDSAGAYVTAVGRQGRGPGEFVAPVDVVVAGTSVYLLDIGTFRITTYAITADELVFKGSRRLDFEPAAACALGDRLFVFGWYRNRIVHELSASGDVLRSFGEPLSADPVLAERAVDGLIGCGSDSSGVIAVAPGLLGSVRAYTPDGNLLWTSELPDYRRTVITRTAGGVRYTGSPEGPSHVTVSMAMMGPRLLVQYGTTRHGMGSPEDVIEVESAILRVADGALVEKTDAYPRVDLAARDMLYSHANQPHPRVLSYVMRRTR